MSNLDECVELLAGEAHPRQLMEGALRMIVRTARASKGGVFTLAEGRLSLEASRRIDQRGIDLVHRLWGEHAVALADGRVVEHAADACGPDASPLLSAALVAINEPPLGPVALVYVESDDPAFRLGPAIERVRRLCRLIHKAVSMPLTTEYGPLTSASWETYLEETPREEIERQQLLLLLRRHEWNIAKVARVVGVTRRTIYSRLEHHGIERQKVSKARRRLGGRLATS